MVPSDGLKELFKQQKTNKGSNCTGLVPLGSPAKNARKLLGHEPAEHAICYTHNSLKDPEPPVNVITLTHERPEERNINDTASSFTTLLLQGVRHDLRKGVGGEHTHLGRPGTEPMSAAFQ